MPTPEASGQTLREALGRRIAVTTAASAIAPAV
jgi:hypothetical protein